MGAKQSYDYQALLMPALKDYVFVMQTQDRRFGEVGFFRHRVTNQIVFAKIVDERPPLFASALRRFLEERQRLSHPNILSMTHPPLPISVPDAFALIFEAWDGDLETAIHSNRRSLDESDVFQLALGAVRGLAFLQSKDIPHGYLRPNSLLLLRNGGIKLAPHSFFQGLSHLLSLVEDGVERVFIAPEDVGLRASAFASRDPFKADVFCLGIVLLKAALQDKFEPFYAEGGAMDILAFNRNIAAATLGFSPRLTSVLGAMLTFDPKTRADPMSLQKMMEGGRAQPLALQYSPIKLIGPQHSASPHRIVQHPRTPVKRLFGTADTKTKGRQEPERFFSTQMVDTAAKQRGRNVPSDQQSTKRAVRKETPNTGQKLNASHLRQVVASPFHECAEVRPSPPRARLTTDNQHTRSTPYIAVGIPSPMNLVSARFPEPTESYSVPIATNQREVSNSSGGNSRDPMQILTKIIESQGADEVGRKSRSRAASVMVDPKEAGDFLGQQSPPVKDESRGPSETYTERYSDGSRYEGEMLDGLRNGRGRFFYRGGGYYDGEWKKGKMEGYGRLFYASNTLAYEGEWRDDKFHGRGALYNDAPLRDDARIDPDNFDTIGERWLRYEGEFRLDLRHGIGTCYFVDGSRYEGSFVNDKIDGEGQFFRENESNPLQGIWQDNKLIQIFP